MFKHLLLIVLIVPIFASECFLEKRYIYAIDQEFSYEGCISVFDEEIKIRYSKPKQVDISYLLHSQNVEERYFFTIFQALYMQDNKKLQKYFKIQKYDNVFILTPIESFKQFLQKIEYKVSKGNLEEIHIVMQNGDWIKIETIF